MAHQIMKSGLLALGLLATIPVSAAEHDLTTLMGEHVLQVSADQGHLASTASFAKDAVTTCEQHKQAVSEMADRFRETRQVQSLLAGAQEAPAAARDVRTRVATMMIDRLISQGEDTLPAVVEDLAAEVLFACYEGALLAAQNAPEPEAPSTAEGVQPEQAQLETEPLALTPSSTLEPSSRPVSRPAPDVELAAPEVEVAQPAPEPAPPIAEPPPPPPPPPVLEPSSRPVLRPAPSLAQEVEPEPDAAPPAAPLQPEAENAPVVAETTQPEPEPPALAGEAPAPSPSVEADDDSLVAEPAQPDPEPTAEILSWGVILTAQNSREAAERQAARIVSLIPEERIDYAQMRVPGQSDLRHVARVGRASRDEAEELCERLKSQGAACIVLRN